MLNVLGEKESGPTMRHFLKRFPAGADRFEGVDIRLAKNGSPILGTSIAHIELKVCMHNCHHLSYQCDQCFFLDGFLDAKKST